MTNMVVATATVTITTGSNAVWTVLTDPELASQAFFGATVTTDWSVGGPITFSGEWDGKPFVDKGTIVRLVPERLLEMTYWSPLSGTADEPANYATVTFTLDPTGSGTTLTVTQSNVADEPARVQAEANWTQALTTIKTLAEK